MRRHSFSKVSTFLRCPRLYRNRYIERSEPERLSLALPLGSAMHDCLQWDVAERARGREPTTANIHTVFQELLEARVEVSSCPVVGDVAEAVETGQRMVEAYVAWGRVQGISSIEGEHSADIGSGLELEGRIDFVRDDETGVELVELKTSARAWSQSQVDLSLQAASYSLLTGIPTVRYVILTKTKAPKVQELVTHCDAQRQSRLRDTIVAVDAAIQAGAFPRNQSPMTCGGCEFRDRCLGVATPTSSAATISVA